MSTPYPYYHSGAFYYKTVFYGSKQDKTATFEHLSEIPLGKDKYPNLRIKSIKYWVSKQLPSCLNGLRTVFTLTTKEGSEFSSQEHFILNDMGQTNEFFFDKDEIITRVDIYHDIYIAGLKVFTNKKNSYLMGCDTLNKKRVNMTKLDLAKSNEFIFGIIGGVGTHLDQISFIICSPKFSITTLPHMLYSTEIYGCNYPDSKIFNDVLDFQEKSLNLLQYRIKKMKFWFGDSKGHMNGIQVVFEDRYTGHNYTTDEHCGKMDLKANKEIIVDENQDILKITTSHTGFIEGLKFHVMQKGVQSTIEVGKTTGKQDVLELKSTNRVLIGFFGGTGGHLHTLGFYTVEKKYVTYYKRRIYILMRHRLLRDSRYREKMSKVENAVLHSHCHHALVFGKLVYLSGNSEKIFQRVIEYI
jgi:hypothetical protein